MAVDKGRFLSTAENFPRLSPEQWASHGLTVRTAGYRAANAFASELGICPADSDRCLGLLTNSSFPGDPQLTALSRRFSGAVVSS